MILKASFHSGKLSVDWNGQENFSLYKEKLSCPFQSTDNFPEWKLAFKWTSMENSLELTELSSISKVSLV
jgi:hypothetical protein